MSHIAPDDLIDQSCIIVANLEPKILAGIESQGMLLAGLADDGSFSLAQCPDVPPGTRIQ